MRSDEIIILFSPPRTWALLLFLEAANVFLICRFIIYLTFNHLADIFIHFSQGDLWTLLQFPCDVMPPPPHEMLLLICCCIPHGFVLSVLCRKRRFGRSSCRRENELDVNKQRFFKEACWDVWSWRGRPEELPGLMVFLWTHLLPSPPLC